MNLLLFDVDGTLTDTAAEDDRLFRETLLEAMPEGARSILPGPWETFPEATCPAIAREMISRACDRPAREGEIMVIRRALTIKWQQALDSGTVTVRARPGAREIFEAAGRRPGFIAAIATGGWGPTAVLKLAAAGFRVDDLVLATADDAETRLEIINTAKILAAASRGVPGFSAAVMIGDGLRHARAAHRAQAGFIGVADNKEAAAILRSAGAAAVVPHFEAAEPFWGAVKAALAQQHAAGSN